MGSRLRQSGLRATKGTALNRWPDMAAVRSASPSRSGERMPNLIHSELTDRYLKRSSLFWKFARDAKFAKWQQEARSAAWRNLQWTWDELGISDDARQVAERRGFVPSEVFAHPEVLRKNPDLQKYYRLLACL